MAVQAVDTTSGAKTQAPGPIQETPNDSVQKQAQDAAQNILSTVDKYGSQAAKKGQGMLDSIFPPEKRTAFLEKIQAFSSSSPKLSAFLGLNLLLTGVPLLLFILFAISTLVVSLLVALITAILAAATFTLIAVGAALLVVLPTVLLTTFTACSIFLWGLAGFYVFQWANSGTAKQSPESKTIGDKLDQFAGGVQDRVQGGAESRDEKVR